MLVRSGFDLTLSIDYINLALAMFTCSDNFVAVVIFSRKIKDAHQKD